MSQRRRESPSFPLSEIFDADLEEEIFQQVNSQDIKAIFDTDLSGEPYPNDAYENEVVQDDITVSFEEMKFFPFMPQQLLPLAASDVPSNEEYIGPYNFEVVVLPNHKSKSPWVYSIPLNKVFMGMSQQFPVDFKVKSRPNMPLFVRTTPQYSAQHQASEAVCRCLQHCHPSDPTNKDIDESVLQHVIRCSNQGSQYIGNVKNNQRLSVVFPLLKPQVGSESVREFFQFVCLSSCPAPGINRRGVEVIFTLEDHKGNVLGRKCLNVRICACPKRDKEKEENELNINGNQVPKGKKRKAEHPPPSNVGKVLDPQDDFKVYTLNMPFVGKQNTLDILAYAEKIYMANAYRLQGQMGEQTMKKTLAEIQSLKKQFQ